MADDVEPGSDEALARIHDSWRRQLDPWRERTGITGEIEVREQQLGRRIVEDVLVDGVEDRDPHLPFGLMSSLGRWWQDRTGEVPYEIWQRLPAEGDVPLPDRVVCDRPPSAPELRTTSAALAELRARPRPPEQVPGWIKVELALVGAWDLRADRSTVNRLGEPTGEPQTPASVGLAPPPGAEHAWSPQWRDAAPPPTEWERGEPDLQAWPSGAPPLPAWTVALAVARWRLLRVEGVVDVLPPVTERLEPDLAADHAGLPPALHEVAAAVGGITVGAWEVRWRTELSRASWQLGDRLTYVPLDDDAEPLALRVDPTTGAPGEVVQVDRLADEPRLVAPDLPTFLGRLAELARAELRELVEEAVGALVDGEVQDEDLPDIADQAGDWWADAVRRAVLDGTWPDPPGPEACAEDEQAVVGLVHRWLAEGLGPGPWSATFRVHPEGAVTVTLVRRRGPFRARVVENVPTHQAVLVLALQQLATLRGRPWVELELAVDRDGAVRLEPRAR